MIHGVAKHTTQAAGALDYFLDAEYLHKESGEWRVREPAPELLEGDPMQMRALCDSLPYKNEYVSAVLSFSKEETAHINATPGMKEELIEDLRSFIYAGFRNDDSKAMLVVQHAHLDRLELHYMVPRVSLESGLSFSPFPVKYDDTPPSALNLFIHQNNTFVDHVCEKYGLQNPRDPAVQRAVEVPVFDIPSQSRDIRRAVVKALDKLVDCGSAKSRDDMTAFLKANGAEITRQGKDSFSFKFPEMGKAIRLKGELYGEQSFNAIREHFDQRKQDFEATRETASARYAEVFNKRAEEIEVRHGKRTDEAERAKEIDPVAERELNETAKTLEDKLDDISSSISDLVSECVRDNPDLMKACSMGSGSPAGPQSDLGPGSVESADTSAGTTGNPVLDSLIASFHNWLKAQAKKAAAAASAPFPGKRSESAKSGIMDFVRAFTQQVSYKVSVATGYNFVEPDRGNLKLDDMKLYKKAITEQLREAQKNLKELEKLHRAENKVNEISDTFKMVDKLKTGLPGLELNSSSLETSMKRWADDMKERGIPEKRKKHRRDESGLDI